jgi:hypothetical protein
MKDLVNRIQRELPDTDKDRYDVAYERGQAQARSGLLFGGLAFGALLGAAATFLFDPDRGASRRAQIASRVTGIRGDLQNRAKGTAIEAGFENPKQGVPAHSSAREAAQRLGIVPDGSNGTSVAGLPAAGAGPGRPKAESDAMEASEGHAAG